jgi:hypothetical protein
MLKPMMLKLVRKEEEDRGVKAPVLLARPNRLARRLGRASRGYMLAGAGVVVGAVGFVSLLSWLAPDSDRPIGHPLEVVERILPGVLEQADDQVAALLGTEGETVLRDVRENLRAVGSRIPWSGRVGEIPPDRSSASSSPSAPVPTTRPTPNTPAQEEPSSPATNETSPTTYAPSPSNANHPSSTSETPPATEAQPPATTGEPAPPPPATEEPPTPPAEEPLPPIEEPPTAEEPSTPPAEEPLPAEEPPVEEVPPPTDEPAPSTTEEPPPTTDQPPSQPPLPPTGLTKDAE